MYFTHILPVIILPHWLHWLQFYREKEREKENEHKL